MRIKNLPSILSMDGSQDALVIEQTDGSEDKSRKVSPAQIKQYVLGNSIDDIYSVMGQNGAKNLIPYPYYESDHTESGITWTVNSDGSVTANGTATANSTFIFRQRTEQTKFVAKNTSYIMSGCPSGGSNSKYMLYLFVQTQEPTNITSGTDYGNGATINMPDQDYYGIYAFAKVISGQTVSNLTFKPMLRLASDTDNTYQPYAKTNKQLTDDKAEVVSVRDYVNELGVKNLLVPKWTETQTTENGVTYTFNAAGTIVMNTDESGATADTNCNLKNVQSSTDNIYPAGTYTISGCPSGGTGSTYRTWARAYRPGDTASSLTGNLYDDGNGVTFTVNETFQLAINLTVRKDYVCNNLTWKPMLRLASDINDDTYVQFAKSNRQLTEVIGDLSQTGLTGDSVSEQLATAGEQITDKVKRIISQNNYTCSSTSYEYTGVSVACPADHIYMVRARAVYFNSQPSGIVASTSSTSYGLHQCYDRNDSASYITFILAPGETAYIWGRWSSANTKNRIDLEVIDITL